MCRKGATDVSSLLFEDILKYLELYEENCQLVLNSNSYLTMKEANPQDLKLSKFLQIQLISPELMFMDLNHNYIYGEAEED